MGTQAIFNGLTQILSGKPQQNKGISPGNPLADASQKQEDPQEQLVDFPAPKGHGSGCSHCMHPSMYANGGKVKAKDLQAAKQASLQQRIAEVVAHEMAHQAGAGGLAGAMSIKVGEDGSVSGEVPIQMPGLNSEHPEKTVEDAQKVISGALAPGDPSSQDFAVAAKARSVLAQAQSLQAQKSEKEKKQPQLSLSA